MQDNIKAEYTGRINRVLELIEKNPENSFTLKELSQAACYSPYHFHRIFTAIIGEPPGIYI